MGAGAPAGRPAPRPPWGWLVLALAAPVEDCGCECGYAPLNDAARHGDDKMVHDLLAAGADPDHVDPDGFAPINEASMQGDAEMVADLLAHGANPNHAAPGPGLQPE